MAETGRQGFLEGRTRSGKRAVVASLIFNALTTIWALWALGLFGGAGPRAATGADGGPALWDPTGLGTIIAVLILGEVVMLVAFLLTRPRAEGAGLASR